MRRLILAVLLAGMVFGAGCKVVPKPVELLQKKVQPVPAQTVEHREREKQAVALAATKAREAEAQAKADGSLAFYPAQQAAALSEAVGRSVGPPVKKWEAPTVELVDRLDAATAKLDGRVEEYRREVRAVEGKKIEGTGLFQVPYFAWLAGVLVVGLVGFIVLRIVMQAIALSNPPAALGLRALDAGGKLASRAFTSVLRGGERFKARLSELVTDDKLREQIREAFRVEQERSQDDDVQTLVQQLTKR